MLQLGIGTTAVLEAMEESLKKGKPVKVKEILGDVLHDNNKI
jgi:hypothetical protein